jgi:hypothetical protein
VRALQPGVLAGAPLGVHHLATGLPRVDEFEADCGWVLQVGIHDDHRVAPGVVHARSR